MGLVTYLYTSMNLHATQKEKATKLRIQNLLKLLVIKNQIS